MCAAMLLLATLVGGRWNNALSCGLWYWNYNNASADYSTSVGARPLVLKIGIWCVCFVVYDCLLLSAVVMSTTFGVACGIGTLARRLLLLPSTSELDYLSLNPYTSFSLALAKN